MAQSLALHASLMPLLTMTMMNMCVVELMMTGAPTLCTTSDIWLDFKAQFAFTLGITKSYNVPTIEDTIMMCKRCTRDTHTPNLVPTGWILRQILCKQYYM